MIKNIKILALASLFFVACEKEEEKIVVANSSDGLALTAGTANFAKYVAIGNSLTAGFSDNSLFKAGQLGSWTNILAEQFKTVGGGEFKIPLTNNNVGGLLFNSNVNPRFGARFYFTGNPDSPVAQASGVGVATNEVFNQTLAIGGPYNNVGVPGAKSFHVLSSGYGQLLNLITVPPTANPYYARFAPQGADAKSMLNYAFDQKPTFFSLWIGNNDVLSYATFGGDGVDQTGNPNAASYSDSDITDPTLFSGVYNNLLNKLTSEGAKGAVANIPYVTSLPFFYAIKYNRLTQANLTVQGVNQVPELNAKLYGPLKLALSNLGQGSRLNLLATTGNNPMIMRDKSLTDVSTDLTTQLTTIFTAAGLPPALAAGQAAVLGSVFGQARQTKETDLICFSSATRIGQAPNVPQDGVTSPAPTINAMGVSFPLPDRYVLTPSEVQTVTVATDAYNASIKSLATAKGLAFIDANLILKNLFSFGANEGGFTLRATYATGGAFSMDGVHPAPRGYALIANSFIREINKTYGSNIKTVDLGNYRFLYPAVIGDGNK